MKPPSINKDKDKERETKRRDRRGTDPPKLTTITISQKSLLGFFVMVPKLALIIWVTFEICHKKGNAVKMP